MVVDTGTFKVVVPAVKATPFKSYIGKRVTFGIRPEDIHDLEFAPPSITAAQLEANVDVVEQMGNEMIIYLEDGGKSFIARTDPRTKARVGARMGVVLNLDNMHLFDIDTQLSLSYDFKRDQAMAAV
jgi:multiple sugar transport system ATP-binding protein